MIKKFNQVWANQTNLGKKFGLSAVDVGKILIEYELLYTSGPQMVHGN